MKACLPPLARLDATIEEPILIQRASQGDTDAFTVLFHRYHAMIHAFAYRLCLDPVEAQDVAQETFIHAARALGRFASEGKTGGFRPWLYRIALNAARDSLRRRGRREALCDEIAFRQTRPERVHAGRHTEVEAALATLPEDLRRALVLVFYEGLSHAQAAAVLGCAETTVSWRVFRAKRLLRKKRLSSTLHPADHEL